MCHINKRIQKMMYRFRTFCFVLLLGLAFAVTSCSKKGGTFGGTFGGGTFGVSPFFKR